MTAKKKNKIIGPLIIVGVIILFIVLAYNSSNTTKKYPNEAKIEALALKENKVKDAYINEAGVLYVQVPNDGTSRDGYAQYLCEQMSDNGFQVKKVVVLIVGSQKWDRDKRDCAYGKIIGEASCF